MNGDKLVRLTRQDDYEKRWIVVGTLGAVDFHCCHADLKVAQLFHRVGGVEYHYRTPPDYMNHEPSHESCWILGGKCWHDGTSLWATEHWIPLLESSGEDAIWQELEHTYRRHFQPAVEQRA